MKEYIVSLNKELNPNLIWFAIRDIRAYSIKLEVLTILQPIFLIQTDEINVEKIRNVRGVQTIEENSYYGCLCE